MEVKDKEQYEKWLKKYSSTIYGPRLIDYATKWADGVEKHLANGDDFARSVFEAEKQTSNEYGATGGAFGTALTFLIEVWVHGELLRRLYNVKR